MGRRNVQTCAKEVRFVLGESAVATGGDDGALYVWCVRDVTGIRDCTDSKLGFESVCVCTECTLA